MVEDIENTETLSAQNSAVRRLRKKHKKRRNKWFVVITVVIIAVIVVAGGVTSGLLVHRHQVKVAQEAHAAALTMCVKNQKALGTVIGAYTQAVSSDDTVAARKITSAQVADAATVSTLSDVTSFTAPVLQPCGTTLTTEKLDALSAKAKNEVSQYEKESTSVARAVKAVNESHAVKQKSDALGALQKELPAAQNLFSSSAGKVASRDMTRAALQSEVAKAQDIAAASSSKTTEDLTGEVTKLKASEQDVSAAVSAKARADAAAAAAKARAEAAKRLQQILAQMPSGSAKSATQIETAWKAWVAANGGSGDFDGYAGLQCVDFVDFYVKNFTSLAYGGGNGAQVASDTAAKNGLSTSSIPTAPAIFSIKSGYAEWGGSGRVEGHTGIVLAVNGSQATIAYTGNSMKNTAGTLYVETVAIPTDGSVTFLNVGKYVK
jgi:hypothetical protein